jgi:hypothetical protein
MDISCFLLQLAEYCINIILLSLLGRIPGPSRKD